MAELAGLFFTGTDTGVGKTFVMAAVARELRRQGQSVRVCKPVATGARCTEGEWVSDDTVELARAAGLPRSQWHRITPWTFSAAAAPPVAARASGATLCLSELAASVRANAESETLVLVEGVGGLLCPLTECETVADLAATLDLPLVIVTRRALGTLNHTLLTLEAARSRRLPIAGIVINETVPPQGLAELTNVEELRRRIDVPLLAVVPFQSRAELDILPVVADVNWQWLARAPTLISH